MKNALYLLSVLFIMISCKKTQDETNNSFKFRDYISYTTAGPQLSTALPIDVSFTKPVEGWEEGQEISEKLITVKPHVKGKLTVLNNHTLRFIPNETLNPDTEYTVTVKLSRIYKNIPEGYQNYTFRFKTVKSNFTIVTKFLQSYSKEWQYLEGILRTSDVIKIEDAKKLVQATQGKKQLPIVFNEYDTRAKYFEFKIDSIRRKMEDDSIHVQWDGKPIKAENKGENNIAIPGINNFKIVSVNVVQMPEQYLSINFSDPLKKQQNFQGLVNIETIKNPKYVLDGNVLKVYPESRLAGNIQVNIFQGIKNDQGYKLKTPFSEYITFEQLKPNARLINSGTILPNSKNLKLNFEAVNLSAIDVRVIKIYQDNILQFLQDNNLNSNNSNSIKKVGRRIVKQTISLQTPASNTGEWKPYTIDLAKYLNADPGAIYRIELSYNKSYSLYDCSINTDASTDNNDDDDYDYYDYYEDYDDYSDITFEDQEEREEAYWDNLTNSYKDYNYSWSERNNPCHDAYYNKNRIVSQNLLASNLGVVAKKGTNNSYYFAVASILNTNPEPGAKISIYNFQQQEIARAITDEQGLVIIDANKRAAFAIISKGKSTTYIKLNDANSLSLSKFDVSGSKLQRGLKGYIYGERGVWRPGDTLHLAFMLNDKANPLPANHPVKMEVTDPQGKLVYKKITSQNLNNIFKFTIPTSVNDKTGKYSAKVSVGGATFYKYLKIETIKPNRLKIKIDFDDEVLSKTKPLNGVLDVKWLHGSPGKYLDAEVKVKFANNKTPFKTYKNYIFTDPTRNFLTEEMTIFDDEVDENGLANINKQLTVGKQAPGMLKAQFLVRAFENGGDFSIDAFTKPYAPFTSFVGLQKPKPDSYNAYNTNENKTFNVVTVNANGSPIKQNNLEVKIYKIKWRWWWSSSNEDLSNYTSSKYHEPVSSFKINTDAKGKSSFNVNIPDKEGGRYLIRVIDPTNGHATGCTVYFYKDWWRNTPSEDKEAAKMLVFSSDKDTYQVGETAKVTFASSSEGRALISIENGTEVLSQTWAKTLKGETTVNIPITKEMAPNVFINISLLQPHAITSNDLPIRLYGLIPIMVEDLETKLQPVLNMPDKLRPEQEFSIKISEANKKPMTYTLAVVEEGLLGLTRFKTPNAWHEFYKREALGVKTWDVFDDVIGAYSGSIDHIFAIGGDGSATGGKNRKANRFKPVVTYLGPFELQPEQTNTHTIKLPNYIGSVRAMVVASNHKTEAYGSAEKSVEVKKPLMVLATLPRKLSPGEKVTLPVTVFAMEPKVKNATIKLKLSSGIKVVGEATKQITFDRPDEKMVYFQLDVSQAKGINTLEVIATGSGEQSNYNLEFDVVNPNPVTSKLIDKTINASTKTTIDFSTFGVIGSNSATIECSTLPPMNFSKRLKYLIQYPHGCVEQTTSSVFPQLFLSDIFDTTFEIKQKTQKNIEAAIKRLGHFQRPNGGLSYWLGGRSASDWGTSYAGHFMIEAEKKGFILPLTFKSNWIIYQKEAARNWRPYYRTRRYSNDLEQAYRLYTLALAGDPDLASMNRLREFSEISNDAKWRLAAAYALVGQKEASEAISASANINFKPSRYNYYTYGSVNRNRAMALETMVLTKNANMRELAEYIAKELSSDQWMSTQTTAYSLLAMAKMVNANGGKAINVSYSINGKSETIDSKNAIALRELEVKDGLNHLTITNQKDNVVYVRVLNAGKLPLGKEITTQRGLSVSVAYKTLNGTSIDVTKLKQGDDFIATVKVSNLKHEHVENIALTQIFPSGWDIVNTRFTDFGDSTTNQADYTDIRDDRVNFYFNLSKTGEDSSTKTFNIMLNASYLGTYYLYGVQAEAMYDNDYLVRTEGKWVTVEQ